VRKIIGISGAVAFAGATVLSAGLAFATAPTTYTDHNEDASSFVEPGGHKITFCHRTGAENKYVVITTDIAAVDGGADSDHSTHNQVGNGPIGDIIPPIDGVDSGEGEGNGKNWDGQWLPGTTKKDIAKGDLCNGIPSDYS